MSPRTRLILAAALALLAGVAAAAPLTSGGPVDITADRLDVTHANGKATFSGHVVVKQGTMVLRAPRLTVSYSAGGKGGDVEQLQASGGVTITRGGAGGVTETATGSTATYHPSGQQLVLTGQTVTLTRGASTLEGDKLVYNLKTGNARVTSSAGPVKARFVPPAKAASPTAP